MTGILWLPGRPLLDSREADALDDLAPTPRPVLDPWVTTRQTPSAT